MTVISEYKVMLKADYYASSKLGSERVFKLEASMYTDHIRRSDSNRQKLIHKAKMKSLRISVVIVAAFIICWTPYYAMMLIFMFMNPDERLSEVSSPLSNLQLTINLSSASFRTFNRAYSSSE
jgi:hypothetical protein